MLDKVKGPSPDTGNWSAADRFLKLINDPWYRLLLDLQHQLTVATHAYWAERNCKTLHLPITTHSISSPMGLGSDSLPVEVELCGVRTFLADSMQFMLEYGCRLNAGGAFYLMPSFRGEDADSTHLCQFYHSEVEIRGGLEDAMVSAENYIKAMALEILANCSEELALRANGTAHLESFVATTIPRVRFDEAAKILGENSDLIVQREGWRNITRLGERHLMEHFGGPVWITHWDHLAVPFYQAFDPEERTKAMNADLLLGTGEVLGLGERHATGVEVRASLELHQVTHESYRWYIEMKDSFPLKTAGYGMGVERFLLWVLGHDDIRDLQILPRFNGQSVVP